MTRKRSRSITAAEFMKQLQKDPAYQARQQELEEGRQSRLADYERAAAPVIAELDQVAIRVARIGELRQSRRAYPAALPILLRWLPKIEEPSVKEDIIRTLSVPWAAPEAIDPCSRSSTRRRPGRPVSDG